MVYIYCRVSTKKQEDNYSFPKQKERGIAFATELNHNYELYSESASGTTKGLGNRKEWLRLLNDLEKAESTDILWYGNDKRLTRNLTDYETIEELCRRKKIKLYEDREKRFIDFTIRSERIMGGFKAVMAKDDASDLEEKLSDGLRESWDAGYRVHTKTYGYDSSTFNPETGKKVWRKVPKEEEIIQLAVKLYLDGEGVRNIARILNNKGYRWRGGKSFTHYEVDLMVSKPIYAGLTTDSHGKERKSELYDPIITLDQWRKLEAMLPLRKKKGRDGRAVKHPLSSVLRCASCGMPYEFAPDTRGHFYYRHKGPKPKECIGRGTVTESGAEYLVFEAYVWGITNMTDKTLSEIKEKLLGSESENDLERFDKLISDLQKKIKNWDEAVGAGGSAAAHYAKLTNDALAEVDRLQAQKSKIVHANEESLEKYHQAVLAYSSNSIREFFRTKDGRSRNAMLCSVLKAVHVPNGNVFTVEYQDGRTRTMIYLPKINLKELDTVNVLAMEDWDDKKWKLFLRGKTIGDAASLLDKKSGKDARYPKAKKNAKKTAEAKEIMKALITEKKTLQSE